MDTADVSLVTYTYNDGHFVDGLLAELPSWSVSPREVVIIDDGSATPYTPPPSNLPVRLIRHKTNQGIPATKHEGISAASACLILAMDCDTRVVPDWLGLCLPHAQRPEVGLVSGPVIYLSGNDLVSRFQRYFGDNHNLECSGAVDFVPGNAFLLRKETWETCGGIADFQGEVCEDHFLGTKLKNMGLLLWIETQARAKQIRRITRLAMLKRFWKWAHIAVKGEAMMADDIPAYVFAGLATPHAARVETAINRDEPIFIYLEVAFLSFTVLDLLDYLIRHGRVNASLKAAWWGQLQHRFQRFPTLWECLSTDLTRLGQVPVTSIAPECENLWESAFSVLDAIAPSGIYRWLDKQGIPAMLAEEQALAFDFSFYEAATLTDGEQRADTSQA